MQAPIRRFDLPAGGTTLFVDVTTLSQVVYTGSGTLSGSVTINPDGVGVTGLTYSVDITLLYIGF